MNEGDYGSEFEYDSEVERKKAKKEDLKNLLPKKQKKAAVASSRDLADEYDKEEGRKQRFHILSLDAYSRHKKLINDYLLYYGGSSQHLQRDRSTDKTDIDIVRENHRFLWNEEDAPHETWEKRLSKKYYDKLFKEYCITDLSRYKHNQFAMRWRIEAEVISGKGQFKCGAKKCEETIGLRSWEVNFGYVEHGQKKNALVKLRLCPDCSYKLNYHHKRKEVKKGKRKAGSPTETESSKKARHTDDAPQSEEGDEGDATKSTSAAESASTDKGDKQPTGDDIWAGPAPVAEDKSRDVEFEDYFEDMFL